MLLARAVLSRPRVQDPSAADRVRRRERAQYEAVAGGGHQRALEAQLRKPRLPRLEPLAFDGRDARAAVSRVPWCTWTRRPRASGRVPASRRTSTSSRYPRRRCCISVDHHVPTLDVAALDSGEVERDSLSRLGPRRATRHAPPPPAPARARRRARSGPPSPRAMLPDQSVPVTTVPMPCSVKLRSTCNRAGPPRRARSGAARAARLEPLRAARRGPCRAPR